MKIFSVILFIAAFLILRTLFAVFVSDVGTHMLFADQISGFLFVILKGKWFLKYNSKWVYIYSVSVFYMIVAFLLAKNFAIAGMLILLLPISIYLAFKAVEKKAFIKNGTIVLLIALFSAYLVFPNYFQFYYTYIEKEETKINQ